MSESRAKGVENCHFGAKNTWWFDWFFLGDWWSKDPLGDGDIGHFWVVIWAIFRWWFGDWRGVYLPPLLSCLSKRVGILTKIHKYLSRKSFQKVMNGLFNGKLIYGISVWGSVWNLPGVLDIERRHSPALSKDDHNKLQILQNKVFRLATGLSIT